MTNSGTPSFLVGTQDIGPHEVSCLIHVPILSPLPFYTIPIFLFNFLNFFIYDNYNYNYVFYFILILNSIFFSFLVFFFASPFFHSFLESALST